MFLISGFQYSVIFIVFIIGYSLQVRKRYVALQTAGMYKLDCDFGLSYIRQTKRSVGTRVEKDVTDVKHSRACLEEVTQSGIQVTWRQQSDETSDIVSDPLCFYNNTLITRNCTSDEWIPSLDQLKPCYKAVKYFNSSSSCPPGFNKLSENNNKYCYQISKPSVWNYPCLESGGATIVTELTDNETDSLIISLNSSDHRYFWLPAKRQQMFAPIVWYIPGPNWGQEIVVNNNLPLLSSHLKTCLLLDVQERIMKTETCTKEHPSLCFYINDLNYPAKCPQGYYAFRHLLDDGRCFGIEKSNKDMTFDEFNYSKCKQPMGDGYNNELRRFIFSKIAESNNLPENVWCWFSSPIQNITHVGLIAHTTNATVKEEGWTSRMKYIINNVGILNLLDSVRSLPCMACEVDIIYGNTELDFEYNASDKKIYLTVYFPSGLWKYNKDDRGIQCFSDAKGFFRVIDVYDSIPLVSFTVKSIKSSENMLIEKSIFEVNLVTDWSARYWCEGHTKNFSLITTEKIVVNPQGNEVHVFSLVLEINIYLNEIEKDIPQILIGLTENLNEIFEAEKVILMDILDYSTSTMQVLLHVHVPINNTYNKEALNLLNAYDILKDKIDVSFPQANYTFINMSSSVYCLPTTSLDTITLYWELTPIGNIVAPRQFCLQSNGLPVNRQCHGSYLFGSFWGVVEGQCDKSYKPSFTTTLLFNFIQGNMGHEFASHFLTTGLEMVLSDTNIIIPADIYYLSVSFQQILNIANNNHTTIETGDIENIAWIMDRIMVVNKNNLRLAQTLNSTNVILDSIHNIIAIITQHGLSSVPNTTNFYQLAIQPRFIVQISYPYLTNITGLAVIRVGSSDKFDEMTVQPIYKNTSINDVMSIENLEIATWFPHHVLKHLKRTNNDSNYSWSKYDMHIVINVYYDDSIFQELTKNKHNINSRIVEVAVPGYTTNVEFAIPLLFRDFKPSATASRMCGFWDFQSDTGILGMWSSRGCIFLVNVKNLTVCECFHLTHFGQLINSNTGSYTPNVQEIHTRALNIITLVGSTLSLMGIMGIWVTAIVFDMWRKKTGTKVLLQLSTAIALPLLLIILFNVDDSIISQIHSPSEVTHQMKIICIALGALFHYSVLTNFTWMLITAILQFLRYVRVLGVSRPSKFLIKMTLMGWGIPSIPVMIVLIVDRDNYIPNPTMERSICYPSGIYMIIGVVLPVCMILIINVVLFLLVIKAISKTSDMRNSDKSLVFAQFRLSIFLFFLLGLTWIFGIMSFSGSIICSYIFCLTSTVQGFVLFIYFIICDPTTRNLWITVMKPNFLSSRNSITTISSG